MRNRAGLAIVCALLALPLVMAGTQVFAQSKGYPGLLPPSGGAATAEGEGEKPKPVYPGLINRPKGSGTHSYDRQTEGKETGARPSGPSYQQHPFARKKPESQQGEEGKTDTAGAKQPPAQVDTAGAALRNFDGDLMKKALLERSREKLAAIKAKGPRKIRARDAAILAEPRKRIDGMLPEERHVKKMVEEVLQPVADKSLSVEVRRHYLKKAEAEISQTIAALEMKKDTPTENLVKRGFPESYLAERSEGVNAALKRANAALKEVRKYL